MVSRKNLLLVDPLLAEQQALTDELVASGYEVKKATNAAEANALLQSFRPDLLLSEVQLPGDMDGLGLVASLKANAPFSTMPVILYGQSPTLPQRIRGLELGVADFLEKPLYLKEILSRIQLLLEKQALQPAPPPPAKTRGDLADENLLQLLLRLLKDGLSGLLQLRHETQSGQVWLNQGEVLDARVGDMRGERALNRLFLWSQGEFALEPQAPLPPPSIELPTKSLLFEGQRRQKEWDQLLPSLPGLQAVLEVDESKRNQRVSIIPDDLELVLGMCDGKRDLQQVIEESGLDEVAALELCSRLYGNGMLRVPLPPGAGAEKSVPAPAPIPHANRLEVTTTPPRSADADEPMAWSSAAADTIIEPAPNFPQIGTSGSNAASPELPQPSAPSAGAGHSWQDSARPQDTLIDDAPLLASDLLPDAPAFSASSQKVSVSFQAPQEATTSSGADTASPTPDPQPGADAAPAASGEAPGQSAAAQNEAAAQAPVPAGTNEAAGPATTAEAVQNGPAPSGNAPPGAESPAAPQSVSPAPNPASQAELPRQEAQATDAKPDVAPATQEQTAGSPAAETQQPNTDAWADEQLRQAAGVEANALSETPDGSAAEGPNLTTDKGSDGPAAESVQPSSGDAPQGATGPVSAPGVADKATSGPDHQQTDAATTDSSNLGRADAELADAESAGSATDNAGDNEPPTPSNAQNASDEVVDEAADSFLQENARARVPDGSFTQNDIPDDSDDDLIAGLNSGKRVGMFLAGGAGLLLVLALIYALLQSSDGNEDENLRADAGVSAPDTNGDTTALTPPPVPETPPVPAVEPAPPSPSQATEKRSRKARKARSPREKKERKERKKASVDKNADEPTRAIAAKPNPKKEDEVYTRKLKEAEKLSKQNNFRAAIAAYLAALEVRANSGEAHLGLGNAYYEVNEVKNAIRHLERAKTLLRKDPQVFVLLGAVYQTANRTKDAVGAYERYLELAPNGRYSRDVRNLLIGLKGQ